MENIIFYTDRYQAVNLIDKELANFVYLNSPITAKIDSYISERIINTELKDKHYINIYIPLSPFSAFTDFLGLRIALYIKLSDSKSKLSNIYIYGSDDAKEFINNECSGIITFQEVSLIDFSKEAINKTLTNKISITEDVWFQQINKMNMPVPEDYFDNHSIANEWGIYQMARNANIKLEEIEGIDFNKFNRLYFKWLIFKNNLNELIPEEQKTEQELYTKKLKGLKVLGNIDVSKFKKK
jgi:hypothetical protein